MIHLSLCLLLSAAFVLANGNAWAIKSAYAFVSLSKAFSDFTWQITALDYGNATAVYINLFSACCNPILQLQLILNSPFVHCRCKKWVVVYCHNRHLALYINYRTFICHCYVKGTSLFCDGAWVEIFMDAPEV